MINAYVKKGGSFLQRLRKEMRTHPALCQTMSERQAVLYSV